MLTRLSRKLLRRSGAKTIELRYVTNRWGHFWGVRLNIADRLPADNGGYYDGTGSTPRRALRMTLGRLDEIPRDPLKQLRAAIGDLGPEGRPMLRALEDASVDVRYRIAEAWKAGRA
jgi:hypothetical protein